jgi:hypothetical protein
MGGYQEAICYFVLVELNPLLVKVLGEVTDWATAGWVVHVKNLKLSHED